MSKPKKRGIQILYYGIPEDVYNRILDTQKEIKKKRKRGQVNMGEAITKLIRGNDKN